MKYLVYVSLVLGLFSCVSKSEYEQVKAELESVKMSADSAKTAGNDAVANIVKMESLLNGIETANQNIRLDLEKGMSFEDFQKKVEAIKSDMENSKKQISALEKKLKNTVSKSMFDKIVGDLKKQLEDKEKTILGLTEQVEKLKGENKALTETVQMQKEEMGKKEEEISKKKTEVSELENKLSETQKQAIKDAAGLFYERGNDKVALAEKIKLAPGKKKDAYREAYEMYKKSFELGYTDAFNKMKETEEKFK
jgi:chromosome segregation ATPase